MNPEQLEVDATVVDLATDKEATIVQFRKFPAGDVWQVRIKYKDGGFANRGHRDLVLTAPAPKIVKQPPTERDELYRSVRDMGADMNEDIRKLLDEAVEEGILDKIKSAVGLGSQEAGVIPRQQWDALMRENRQLVEMLANSPGIQDAANLVTDVLKQLAASGSMEARKAQQQIRQAVAAKDKEALVRLVRSIQQEADKIRAVRTTARKMGESTEIEDIAKVISEDIRSNNGLAID